MATYGHTPGVQITTSTGTVTGVVIGRDQYLTLVGVGSEEGDADPNEPVHIRSESDADEQFGEDSDIARAYRRARDNGANPDYVKAVKAGVEEETYDGTGGSLANAPIIPNTSRIDVDGTDDEYDIVFGYSNGFEDIDVDDGENVVFINPNTGELDGADDVSITYEFPIWDEALSSVEHDFVEGEFGVIAPLTNAPTVKDDLTSLVEDMRNDIKMVVGAAPVEPTGVEDGVPQVDSSEVEQDYDDDTLFLYGPTAEAGSDPAAPEYGIEAFAGVAGKMAGNDNTEPIYDDIVYGLEEMDQKISRADNASFRGEYIIPIREAGEIRIEDNHSTYDQFKNEGWERDYFRRRVVDLTIATSYMITRAQIGSILDSDTVEDVDDSLNEQMREFVDDGLLQAGGQEVEVFRSDDRTIGVELTITPYGVAKQANIDIEVVA